MLRRLAFSRVPLVLSLTGICLLFMLSGPHTRPHVESHLPPVADRIETTRTDHDDHHHLLRHARNQTLGFQKILVINMPTRSDRRDAISLAARLTDLDVEYVDGVTAIEDKAYPERPAGNQKAAIDYCWRAHMNAARLIVEQNLDSALILEDDADWDIRIKSQMQDFARASRLLIQPGQEERDYDGLDEQPLVQPTTSPYGDVNSWDIMWLGHCGSRIQGLAPSPENTDSSADPNLKLNLNTRPGKVIIRNDQTVPEPQHIRYEAGNDALGINYPPHTRVVSHAKGNLCLPAYALSQRGARRLLYEIGINKYWAPLDFMFTHLCAGMYSDIPTGGTDTAGTGTGGGGTGHGYTCLSVQPALFHQHRPKGPARSFSNIDNYRGDINNDQPFTLNVRWSTRINFGRLLAGYAGLGLGSGSESGSGSGSGTGTGSGTGSGSGSSGDVGYVDLWPDGEPYREVERDWLMTA